MNTVEMPQNLFAENITGMMLLKKQSLYIRKKNDENSDGK